MTFASYLLIQKPKFNSGGYIRREVCERKREPR